MRQPATHFMSSHRIFHGTLLCFIYSMKTNKKSKHSLISSSDCSLLSSSIIHSDCPVHTSTSKSRCRIEFRSETSVSAREDNNRKVSETPYRSVWVHAVCLSACSRVCVCVCVLCQPWLASWTVDVRVRDTFTSQA